MGEEERQQEVQGDEDDDNGEEKDDEDEHDGDDEEDEQPPAMPLHRAVRRASWNPELAGNVAGRLLLVAGQPKTRRVSHHAMMTTPSTVSRLEDDLLGSHNQKEHKEEKTGGNAL